MSDKPKDDAARSERLRIALSSIAQVKAFGDINKAPGAEVLKDDFKVVFDTIASLNKDEVDPWLGRKINVLIRKSTRHIVYLDDELHVQWWWARAPEKLEVVSEVQAEVTRLSNDCSFLAHPEFATPWITLRRRLSLSQPDDSARSRLTELRSLLAEAVAHALDSGDLKACRRILEEAETLIQLEKDRRSRPMFIEYFCAFTLVSAFALCAVSYFSQHFTPFAINVVNAAAAGVFGALISAVSRSEKLNLEPRSEKAGLRTEALSRSLVGMGAGILAGLAYDAGLVSAISEAAKNELRAFLTIAAGASERILPAMIQRAEGLSVQSKPITK